MRSTEDMLKNALKNVDEQLSDIDKDIKKTEDELLRLRDRRAEYSEIYHRYEQDLITIQLSRKEE